MAREGEVHLHAGVGARPAGLWVESGLMVTWCHLRAPRGLSGTLSATGTHIRAAAGDPPTHWTATIRETRGTWRNGALLRARPVGMREGRDGGQLPQRLTVEGPRDPALRARPDPRRSGSCAHENRGLCSQLHVRPGQNVGTAHTPVYGRGTNSTVQPRSRCHSASKRHGAPHAATWMGRESLVLRGKPVPARGCEEAAGP